jgi:NAD(P)-dependent dehydrogenase (short-subunit alcohol dehydrogenase family)/acyl dehydratase
MTDRPLATRAFTASDQEAFARLSGDRNPVHMDALAARRTQAGAPVLHGVHGTLWALDRLGADGAPLSELASVKVQFHKFVYLDREVVLRAVRREVHPTRVELSTEGLLATTLDLKFGPRKRPQEEAAVREAPTLAHDAPPAVLALADMDGLAGWLTPPAPREAAMRFPALSAALGEERVTALAQLSTLVGMACPGLHSIFSGFTARFIDGGSRRPGLGWHTLRTDERFNAVWLKAAGSGIEADVQAFVRAAPVEAPRMEALAARVAADEFAGRMALVIGGSRGLGAVTAKLLAAGGARVFATYATGKTEADALVEEIRSARGPTAASGLACDVQGDIEAQLGGLPADITHAYYFATQRIAHQDSRLFSRERFEELCSVHVDGFSKVAGWLAARSTTKPVSILYPSTVFIDERPKGMTEYAMAKAAGEVLARDLAAALGVSITTPRIPRVLTDQTATVPPVQTADAVDVMLPLLRSEPAR